MILARLGALRARRTRLRLVGPGSVAVLSCTRAHGAGDLATVVDASGFWLTAAPNEARFTERTVLARNLVRNPRGVGQAVGAPGSLPSFWTQLVGVSGLSRQMLAPRVIDGRVYTGIRHSGTATTSASITMAYEVSAVTGVVPGQTWTTSASLAIEIASGVAPTVRLSNRQLDAQGASVSLDTAGPVCALSANPQRFGRTTVMAANTASVLPVIRVECINGQDYDFTIWHAEPMLDPASSVRPVSLPPVGELAQSGIYSGGRFQMEVDRTNGTRNPRGEGATTQTFAPTVGGAPATHWTLPNRFSSLSLDVSPISAFGMQGVRLRYYGTTSATPGTETVEFDGRTAFTHAAGATLTRSFFYRLAAGTIPPGLTFVNRIIASDGVPAVMTNAAGPVLPISSAIQRSVETLAVHATADRSAHGLHMNATPASTVCDFTIDLFWPQIEVGSFATSPILPPAGTPGFARRFSDFATGQAAPLLPGGVGTLVFRGTVDGLSGLVLPRVFSLSDGTTANVVEVFTDSGTGAISLQVITGGGTPGSAGLATLAGGSPFALAVAIGGGRVAASVNGGPVGAVASVPAGLTRIDLGNRADGLRPFDGDLSLVEAQFSIPASDAALRALATL